MLNIAQLSILLVAESVDDYLLIRAMLAEALGNHVNLDWARSYDEGREAARGGRYDLGVIDDQLAEGTALALVRALRAQHALLPTILLANPDSSISEHMAAEAGVASFLRKRELTAPLLAQTVAQVYERARHAAEQEQAAGETAVLGVGFRLLFEVSTQPTFIADRHSLVFLEANTAACRYYGYSRAEFFSMSMLDLHAPEELGHLLSQLDPTDPAVRSTGAWRHQRKDGTVLKVEHVGHRFRFGGRDALLVMVTDVTERERAEEALRLRDRALAVIRAGVLIFDATQPDNPTVYVNAAYVELTGYPAAELLGKPYRLLQGAGTDLRTLAELGRAIREGRDHTAVLLNYRKDGTPFWNEVSIALVRDAADRVTHFVGIHVDVTERLRAQEALVFQAAHDSLTALPNRKFLREHLKETLHTAGTTGLPVSLLLLNLDRFKEVNDTFGHYYGDVVLQQVSSRLEPLCDLSTVLARLGSDEFALVLPGADTRRAEEMAHRIHEALEEPFVVEDQALEISATIGIALFPEHGQDQVTLLRHADVALTEAKRTHDGHLFYDATQDPHTPERMTLISDLRHALRTTDLELYYQPKIALSTGRPSGVEALLRWRHPLRGFVPPDRFIPLAEHTGLIVPLTRWVLEAAIRQCGAWSAAGMPLGVAVNMSARLVQETQLPDTISEVLARYGVAPQLLTVEITESWLMADPRRARAILERLHVTGVRIAIDDFGTGYSSLAYLKDLPVDELKVDKSFVLRLNPEIATGDAAIVRSVTALAHALGLQVVAEGVETRAVWEFLTSLGCDMAQGYLFSRPLPVQDLQSWLTAFSPPDTDGS